MRVSILIVTYNHEQYINDAIKSCLMQKNDLETEIILLDDCSTDKTFALASKALEVAKNVTLISNQSNLGITKNYEKGFSLCKGEYVFVLEGDDYWLDTFKVQKQVEFLEQHPFHSMCFHPFIMQEAQSRIFKPFKLQFGDAIDFDSLDAFSKHSFFTFSINDLIRVEGLIGTFSVCCYRRKLLQELPKELFDVVAYDWAVNLFMAHFGLLGRINTVMSVYRFAENAIWSKKTDKERTTQVKELIPVYDKLLGHRYSLLFKEKLKLLDSNNTNVLDQQTQPLKNQLVSPVIRGILKSMLWPVLKKTGREKINRKYLSECILLFKF